MKILIIIQCARLAGTEQATLAAAKLLKKHGEEVHILSLHADTGLGDLCRNCGIPFSTLSRYHGLSGIADIPALFCKIRQYAPDRIELAGHNIGSLIAAGGSGVHTCLSIHFHHAQTARMKWVVFYALATRICHRIHFVSHFIQDEVIDLFRKTPEKAVCFHNLLPLRTNLIAREEARAKWNLKKEDYVIGNAGQLVRRKRFDVFLAVAAACAKRLPDARFLIAGDGEAKPQLEALAAKYGIADKVIFTGWLSDMEYFWGAIDVMLFNSDFDSLGLTPLEAMSRGIPTVASVRNGGLGEILHNERDGILLHDHDCRKLATSIIEIHDNRNWAVFLAKNGEKAVEQKCSEIVYGPQLFAFLDLKSSDDKTNQ